jgi:hypothetical protein
MKKCSQMKYCRADDCANIILESEKYCTNCVLLLFPSLNQYKQDDIYFTLISSNQTKLPIKSSKHIIHEWKFTKFIVNETNDDCYTTLQNAQCKKLCCGCNPTSKCHGHPCDKHIVCRYRCYPSYSMSEIANKGCGNNHFHDFEDYDVC